MNPFFVDHPMASVALAAAFISAIIIVSVEFAIMRRLREIRVLFERALMHGGSIDSAVASIRDGRARDRAELEEKIETAVAGKADKEEVIDLQVRMEKVENRLGIAHVAKET